MSELKLARMYMGDTATWVRDGWPESIGLKYSAKRVAILLVLAEMTDSGRVMGAEKIAKAAGCYPETARRVIRQFELDGVVRCMERGGCGRPSWYVVIPRWD